MRDPIPVTDPADPRLADYVSLTDSSLRKSLEARAGLFVAEGDKVIRRAMTAGFGVRSMLVTEDRLASMVPLARESGAPLYVASPEVAAELTGYRVHRGALASMARRSLPDVAEVVATAHSIVILEDLVDHGNVGAVFRCAAAFGAGAVVLSPRCADPLYRRAIKVSMGAVFAVPYARMTDWRGGLARLRAAGFHLVALTPDQSAVPLGKQRPAQRVALMLGCEGDGLSARWMSEADEAVCIPMSEDAMAMGVDSLNVVAAAAVACHALLPAPRSAAPEDLQAGW